MNSLEHKFPIMSWISSQIKRSVNLTWVCAKYRIRTFTSNRSGRYFHHCQSFNYDCYVRKPANNQIKWIVRHGMSHVPFSSEHYLSKFPYKCPKGTCEYNNIYNENTFCDDFCEFRVTDQSNHDKQRWVYPPQPGKPDNHVENDGVEQVSFLLETMSQPLTVCVEGNIGSGKTTFLKYFKKYPEVCVFDEPISKWRDCQGYNLLDLMYKDPRKWSLCFQSYVQLTMLDLHTKPIVQPIKMMERSILSAQYCFVQNLRDEGLMEDPQFAVLNEWFNFSMANLPIKVDLIVYLRTDPEIAHKRIGQRGRSEENSISLEYLQSVHKHHENWLVHNQKLLPCPVLTIDANTELADMTPNYQLCEETMFQKVAVANC